MRASDFFRWWTARLDELVPAPLRATLRETRASLTLKVDTDRIELSASSADAVVTLDATAGNQAGLDALLSSLSGPPQRIRLALAPSTYLARRLTLPRAARGDLAEAVRYQLPALTPFRADNVLYACGETMVSAANGDLDVWLVAIPRQRLERTLQRIGQSPPRSPLPLQHPPADGETLEIVWRTADRSAPPLRLGRLAWIGMIALWLAVPSVHLYPVGNEQAALDRELATLRKEAREVSALRERLEAVQVQTTWLAERRQAAVSPLGVIDRLSELLDDRTWLQGLDLQGDGLTLRGLSSSTASLIEILEASSLLEDVRFDAAITRDRRGQGDRFNISARIVLTAKDDGA